MAFVVGHAGAIAGWGLGVSRAAQLLRQVVADAPLIIAEVARNDRQLEATQDGLLRLALEQEGERRFCQLFGRRAALRQLRVVVARQRNAVLGRATALGDTYRQ